MLQNQNMSNQQTKENIQNLYNRPPKLKYNYIRWMIFYHKDYVHEKKKRNKLVSSNIRTASNTVKKLERRCKISSCFVVYHKGKLHPCKFDFAFFLYLHLHFFDLSSLYWLHIAYCILFLILEMNSRMCFNISMFHLSCLCWAGLRSWGYS